MKNPKFQLSKDNAGEFRFLLIAVNGEPILRSSEGYTTKQNCQKAIASVKVNARDDDRYDRKTTKADNQYYFILNARNSEELGISEMYESKQNRDNGIEAVKRDAPIAPTEDLT